MNNPFEVIDARLSNIESLLLDIKHNPKPPELPDRLSVSVRPDASCFDNLLEIILEPKLVS